MASSDRDSDTLMDTAEALATAQAMAMTLIGYRVARVLGNPETDARVVVYNDETAAVAVVNVGADDSVDKSGPPPASKAAIDAMPRSTVTEQDGEKDCSICLDEICGGGEVAEMPCKHGFHSACIEKWLRIHGSCPVCRFLMPVEDANDSGGSGGGRRQRRRMLALVVLNAADSRSAEDSDLGSAGSHDSDLGSAD